MSAVQSRCNWGDYRLGSVQRESSFRLQIGKQIHTVQKFHYQIGATEIVLYRVIYLHNVRVRKTRDRCRFVVEAAQFVGATAPGVV
jgi:hypothetical protein